MTLDQWLLSGLVLATVIAVVISLLEYRTQARWRQRDLLKEFIGRWAGEVGIPLEVDALRFEERHLQLPIEEDPRFALAFKLAPKRLRCQYEEFIEDRSTYIKSCHKLYEQIEHECTERTGLPVGHWRDTKNWPEKVLVPDFVRTIYEQIIGTIQDAFQLEDISYNVGTFSHSGKGFLRKGFHLTVTYDGYNGLELAQADNEATLERIKSIHKQMMELDYCRKFVAEVDEIRGLQKKAETIARKVREYLRKLEVS